MSGDLTPLTRTSDWIVVIDGIAGETGTRQKWEYVCCEMNALQASQEALREWQIGVCPDPDEDGDIPDAHIYGIELRNTRVVRVSKA